MGKAARDVNTDVNSRLRFSRLIQKVYLGPVQISKYFLGFLKISKDSKRSSVVLIQILLSHNNFAQKFLRFAR